MMTEQMTTPTIQYSFKEFLFKNHRNRITLCVAAIAIVIQFTIFKYIYPYASFIHGDSFSYLNAAQDNLKINTYMVGYSRFLRLFSVFTKSDTALVLFQYILIQSSISFLLFTVFYYYKLRNITQGILLTFMVFNPLFLHLANLVSSDCVFAALSMVWFTLQLWIVHKPTYRIVVMQSIVLFVLFTIRYNALIYPFVGAIALFLSPLATRIKLIGIGGGLLLCGFFIVYTGYQYKKLTGYWQYSPFSGWQLTNNAMYAYRYVDSAKRKEVPQRFKILDRMIREYFDSTRDTEKFPIEKIQASTVYMWTRGLTLYKYRDQLFKLKDSTASEFKKWASMGPLFKDYGTYIIRRYPWYFARYFLWPNGNKYYAPPVEFLSEYNSGSDRVTHQAQLWFGYKSDKVKSRMKTNKIWILDFYPILSGIINVVMLFTLLCFSLLKGWHNNLVLKNGIILGGLVWFLNAAFTILASSAALRFQSFPVLLTIVFAAILLDWLWVVAVTKDENNNIYVVESTSKELSQNIYT